MTLYTTLKPVGRPTQVNYKLCRVPSSDVVAKKPSITNIYAKMLEGPSRFLGLGACDPYFAAPTIAIEHMNSEQGRWTEIVFSGLFCTPHRLAGGKLSI